MTVHLYGHRPPPVITENERVLLELVDGEYRPAGWFAAQLPYMPQSSVSVALVRLRNRGLVESTKEFFTITLWRRVPPLEPAA